MLASGQKQRGDRMTGIECLQAELKNRGCTRGQIESKAVAIVLDILTESGDNFKQQHDALEELRRLRMEISELRLRKERYQYEIKQEEQTIQQVRKEAQAYIDSFYKALEECETAEGKDMLRLAQMFVNSVDVNSKYDNTAYIIGLAGILSGNKVAPIPELKKINRKLFVKKAEEWIDDDNPYL